MWLLISVVVIVMASIWRLLQIKLPKGHALYNNKAFYNELRIRHCGLQFLKPIFDIRKTGFVETLRWGELQATPKYVREKENLTTRSGVKLERIEINENVCVYRYRSADCPKENIKTLFYYHGGGMVFGPAKGGYTFAVAHDLKDTQIFAVKYRLAPEHPYPTPIDDCVAATRHLLKNREQYNIGSFGLYGESAGGHLTLSVAMDIDFKKEFGELPKVASAIVPMAQCVRFDTASYTTPESQPEMSRNLVMACWLAFAGLDLYDSATNKAIDESSHLGRVSRTNSSMLDAVDPSKIEDLWPRKDKKKLPATPRTNSAVQARFDELFASRHFSPGTSADENLEFVLRNTEKLVVSYAEHDCLRDDGLLLSKRLSGLAEKSGGKFENFMYENVGHMFMISNKRVNSKFGYKGYNDAYMRLLETLKF